LEGKDSGTGRERLKGRTPGRFDKWLTPRFTDALVGLKLTSDRMASILVGEELTPQGKGLLFACLLNREMALAWDMSEIGRIREEVIPPLKIDTVDHEPWQAPGFPVPKALKQAINDMLRDRLRHGILEPCQGPYRHLWFIVEKKNGHHRLVNSATNHQQDPFMRQCKRPSSLVIRNRPCYAPMQEFN
jgi:hypothetical protein